MEAAGTSQLFEAEKGAGLFSLCRSNAEVYTLC